MKRHLRTISVILLKVKKELLIGAKNAAWAISR
jgi:hypothetical protein